MLKKPSRDQVKTSLLVLALAVALPGSPAGAHHSFAMFDYEKDIILDGVIKELVWNNPHVWITLMVKTPEGSEEDWRIEAGSPTNMLRQGWKHESLMPGEKVKIKGHPNRHGEKEISLTSATFANGETSSMGLTGAVPKGQKTEEYKGDFRQN